MLIDAFFFIIPDIQNIIVYPELAFYWDCWIIDPT